MKISEIFYSIQGEGSLVGVPSVFIRTSGCNLRCTWCDTPYTSWQPEGEEKTPDEILDQVKGFGAEYAVVTGGEPMIAPDVVSLTQKLRNEKIHITVETAGTVYQPVSCNLMSISPKLRNSVPLDREGGRWAAQHDRLRYQPAVLKRLLEEYTHQVKFVVEGPGDLEEIGAIRDEIGIARRNIILMPEGTDHETLRKRGEWIAEVCKQEQYRFSPRLHVDLWGARRGV